MKLSEVLSQIRALVKSDHATAVSEPTSVIGRQPTSNNTITDRGSSQKKFDALKAYLEQTKKINDPLLSQLLKFLELELSSLKDSSSIDPATVTQLHSLLNQLLQAPLAHEERLNALRNKLSRNHQTSWQPSEVKTKEKAEIDVTLERIDRLIDSFSEKSAIRAGEEIKSKRHKEKKLIPLPEIVNNGNGKVIKPLEKPSLSSIRNLQGEIFFEVPIDSHTHPNGIEATK